ncbi:uncharacterized protein K441DRAFT_616782 [Cenococcum geophilum 1.58]|uniref:uncharacterized protein n=1 Tax=Cenococcum geophilum 1.58 TaxID=794803 RepID=UPI00358DE8BE|nr:hypothetical protein K441DRAFT_616782 [Cenococcum geophilum 1.58]
MPDSTSSQHLHGGGIFARKGSLFGGARNKGTTSTNSTPSTQPTQSAQPVQPAIPKVNPTTTAPILNNGHASNASFSPPRRKPASSRHSLSSSVTDFGSSLRRSASLRTTSTSSSSHKKTSSTATLALSFSPEKGPASNASRPSLSIATFSRRQKSAENMKPPEGGGGPAAFSKAPLSAVEPPKTPFGMSVPLRYPPSQKQLQAQQINYGQFSGTLGPPAPIAIGPTASGSHNPGVVFQHIHEMASKRISTLDYLRKAHEGRIYWFNTLLFSKSDLSKLSYFDQRKLSRRATNYLLLGFSLPTILDLNSQTPIEYLRALNALLLEFETYQSIHPPDGSSSSSLSRGRIPQMFKRATHAAGGKGRRSSAATDLGLPAPDPASTIEAAGPSFSFPASEHDLLPGEEYTHLLTPSLPFDPDFFETFTTLCDVLIDCYTKVMSLINSPDACVAGVGDLFAKADARVRKIILAGVVREFEDASRSGAKSEVAGVGKVVLGGLM